MAPESPAISKLSRLWHAVTPEPHIAATRAMSRPASRASHKRRRSGAGKKRPSAARLDKKG